MNGDIRDVKKDPILQFSRSPVTNKPTRYRATSTSGLNQIWRPLPEVVLTRQRKQISQPFQSLYLRFPGRPSQGHRRSIARHQLPVEIIGFGMALIILISVSVVE
jgi:hypothetical protein